MSSLRNAIPRRAHKERAQPSSRKKFGLLEKHKDYVERAKAFHKKEDTIRRLREKAANRNEDEFYFKMIKTKVVDGVHKPESDANKYTQEELLLMKTQDIGYILQKLQSERKKIEKLNATLHCTDNQRPNKHVFFAEDREEAKELQSQNLRREVHLPLTSDDLPTNIKRYTLHLASKTLILLSFCLIPYPLKSNILLHFPAEACYGFVVPNILSVLFDALKIINFSKYLNCNKHRADILAC
ncbi:probable U3 small nucleolar RNA-associated protein 11 [Arachis hypogaea]|uniref:probable U3 small nucleolar RNA-associated protein 11 n=1 Tax=Arachis hypogaea TaxID=3818 RepID=UPI0010FC4C45|nr:probable U3 small nucleolar RNA-associated protein 11 [Arachis hypogaea]